MLKGKRTFIVGAIMIGLFIAETILGLDIPRVDGNVALLLEGFGLIGLRLGIAGR